MEVGNLNEYFYGWIESRISSIFDNSVFPEISTDDRVQTIKKVLLKYENIKSEVCK